jgi:hypothetical protein
MVDLLLELGHVQDLLLMVRVAGVPRHLGEELALLGEQRLPLGEQRVTLSEQSVNTRLEARRLPLHVLGHR